MDINVPKNGKFEIPIKKLWNSLIYVYEGEAEYQCKDKSHQIKTNECCVMEKSNF